MLRHFLHPPLYNANFEKSFGTLYTVLYNVVEGTAQVHWPEMEIRQSFNSFTEDRVVPFSTSLRKGLIY